MEYNSGRKSAAVFKLTINGSKRNFYLSENSDINEIKFFANQRAGEENMVVDLRNTDVIGYKMIGNDERYETIDDIDKYIKFLAKLKGNHQDEKNKHF